jgi:uncharacterized integral membrane protein (TIGR00697 family)
METDKINERRQWLFVFLVGLFVTNAVTAELISNKLIQIPISFQLFGFSLGPFTTIIGILPWPIVFLLTDLMNEFYGQRAIRRVSWITASLIAYCFIIVGLSMNIPSVQIPGSNLADDKSFNQVFGQAQMVIIGSIVAFLVSQLLDAYLFAWIKHKTGNRFIWMRSTGSTLLSQLVDSYIVLYIGFVLTNSISFNQFMKIAPTNYVLKMIIALLLTPLIYLGHFLVRKYLGSTENVKGGNKV